ncbi:hypothetical protein ABTI37_20240, partial [Acinetobacter baumannii]
KGISTNNTNIPSLSETKSAKGETINRTSAYPINKSAKGETIIGSDYTFRNGRWSKNNNVNTNTNKPNVDNGNRRPQYYAERRLPLFE